MRENDSSITNDGITMSDDAEIRAMAAMAEPAFAPAVEPEQPCPPVCSCDYCENVEPDATLYPTGGEESREPEQPTLERNREFTCDTCGTACYGTGPRTCPSCREKTTKITRYFARHADGTEAEVTADIKALTESLRTAHERIASLPLPYVHDESDIGELGA